MSHRSSCVSLLIAVMALRTSLLSAFSATRLTTSSRVTTNPRFLASHIARQNQRTSLIAGNRLSLQRLESTKSQDDTAEESTTSSPPKNAPRHDVRNENVEQEMDPEELKIQKNFMEHQQNAPKLGWATDVRTLVQYNHGFAVLSTNSKANPGYPGGSVVGFAPDEDGRPIFIFSGMSTHTQDILKDPRCSLTIASKEFKGAADGRVNFVGDVTLVPSEEREALKQIYKEKHPGAFWVDFGDFNWFRMDEIKDIRFVGGFARAGSITPEEYKNAKPDPISAFGMQIAKHMNEDHMDATKAMIQHYIEGMEVDDAVITSVDSLGMYIKVKRTPRASDQPQQFKLRLPFPRPAVDRKDVRTIIVEMTQASAATANEKSEE